MKKITTLTMVVLLLLGMFTFNASAQENVSVYINSEKIEFDVPAQIMDGRTMVPLRGICEALGLYVNFDNATQQITITNNTTIFNSTFQMVNILGNKGFGIVENNAFRSVESDVPTMTINGRTLVPVRVISESLGCNVEWEPISQSVLISTNVGFPQGQYRVGYDIPAGEYILISDESNGYFALTSDANGNNILQNDMFGNVTYVNALEDTYLELSRCYAIPYTDNVKFDVVDNGYVNGTYKCGKDLPAGTYKLSVVSRGYYAIYNTPYGKIESNDNFYEDKYVTVTNGQYINLSNVKVTLYKNDISSNPAINLDEKYDNGAPTYTAITGIELIEKVMILGTPHYRYQYTVNADVGKYMEALEKNGWTLEDINVSTYTKDMKAIYEKNDEFIEIKVDEHYNNVWIKFYSSDF